MASSSIAQQPYGIPGPELKEPNKGGRKQGADEPRWSARMTYQEFAATASSAQVRYYNNYVTRLIAERRHPDGKIERMVLACPACQSTAVTRLNFTQAILYGEPLKNQCERCRHQFLEADALVLPELP